MVEEMSQGEGKQHQSGEQSGPLQMVAAQQNLHGALVNEINARKASVQLTQADAAWKPVGRHLSAHNADERGRIPGGRPL